MLSPGSVDSISADGTQGAEEEQPWCCESVGGGCQFGRAARDVAARHVERDAAGRGGERCIRCYKNMGSSGTRGSRGRDGADWRRIMLVSQLAGVGTGPGASEGVKNVEDIS